MSVQFWDTQWCMFSFVFFLGLIIRSCNFTYTMRAIISLLIKILRKNVCYLYEFRRSLYHKWILQKPLFYLYFLKPSNIYIMILMIVFNIYSKSPIFMKNRQQLQCIQMKIRIVSIQFESIILYIGLKKDIGQNYWNE